MIFEQAGLMMTRFLCVVVLGGSALLLASCSSRTEPRDDGPPGKGITLEKPAKKETPPAKADPREVTLHLEGMSERLKLI